MPSSNQLAEAGHIAVHAPTPELSVPSLVVGMLIAAVLSSLLGIYYRRYGKSISNRAVLAKDFVLLTLTTTLIITVVKSSLALSLGLVGALSIVRFRAAIKEPEELAYLFLAIAIGLGCGADQWKATILAFFMILIFVHLRTFSADSHNDQNLFVNVDIEEKAHPDTLQRVIKILESHAELVDLRRVDAREKSIHSTFLVQLKSGPTIQEVIDEIQKIQPSAAITFIDHDRRGDV